MSLTKLKTRIAAFLNRFLARFNGAIVSVWDAQHVPLSKMIQGNGAELNVLDLLVRRVLGECQQTGRPFRFVQIGANDGDAIDPLRMLIEKYALTGVLVEPLPTVFEALKKNYAGQPQVSFENAAIGDKNGTLPFYFLEGGPKEASLFSSFNPDAVRGARNESYQEASVRSVQVPVLTPASLLAKHGIDDLSLLVVDTEGWDYKILQAVDFSKTRPRIIEFEHNHLSPSEQEACYNMLIRHGYRLLRMVATDTIAFLEGTEKNG